MKLVPGARKVRDHHLLSSLTPLILSAPPSEHTQNMTTLTLRPAHQAKAALPPPPDQHTFRVPLCALSCTVSFQLELDHVVSCSKASDWRILTYKKALVYVSFENSFFLATHGMQDPYQGLNPHSLQWKLRVLTPGLPGKSCSENSSLAFQAYILLLQWWGGESRPLRR